MYLFSGFAALVASVQLVTSSPVQRNSPPKPDLRLIKTSEDEPAFWVSKQNRFEQYTAKKIGFFDVTDIDDEAILKALETKPEHVKVRRQFSYPKEILHEKEAKRLIEKVNTKGPQSWLKTLTNFFNRHLEAPTGKESAEWLFEKVKQVARSNPKITVSQFEHSFDQPSTIARLPGETDKLVILGAHFDSTAGNATTRSPGADDNGSGTVVILEAMRILAESKFKPHNTVEFHFYAGEEAGLLGSQDIFADYRAKEKTVLAFLNEDMAGYSGSGMFAVFEDYVDVGLTQYVRMIAEEYVGKTPLSGTCGYGCSDHASATANGFPSAFVHADISKNTSPYIHTPQDDYDTIMWDAIYRHSIFTVGFAVEASHL
ncbi:hypothetical protein NLU13_0300 [Sarocladium strictum]|uniref:Peptide hydrolase n=1 Tax=Sarocladium strictum TaxID=5046 RepID=A0AA39LB53_SARSR|nr:hypothetical protein NLU13_0300 [Sarocladium strictum]